MDTGLPRRGEDSGLCSPEGHGQKGDAVLRWLERSPQLWGQHRLGGQGGSVQPAGRCTTACVSPPALTHVLGRGP